MPQFALLLNENGSVRQILRDGQPFDQPIRLEPAYAIVATYFRLAASNIGGMGKACDTELRRFHGIQAFLMTLTGVEAFTNVFFTLRGDEKNNPDLLARVAVKHGPLVPRLRDCIELAFEDSLDDLDQLLARIRDLYALRNQIVHPRWDPASAWLGSEVPILINGLAVNFQAAFEDEGLCREAFLWCMLLVIRIAKAAGNADPAPFCQLWTGQLNVSEEALLSQLGLTSRVVAGG